MKKLKTAAALSLALSLSLPLIACGGSSDSAPSSGGEDQAQAQSAETAAETTTESLLLAADYGGAEFVICDNEPRWSGMFETIDQYAEAENGDTINDAVFRRNTAVEDRFHVTIKEHKTADSLKDSTNSIMAGDHAYDMVWVFKGESPQLTTKGLLLDMKNLPLIALDQPWWDQNCRRELSIAGKTLLMTGALSIMDDDNTMMLVFNKKVMTDVGLEAPYQKALDRTWTWDVLYDMSKQVYSDLNGDGSYDQNDRYGFYVQYYDSGYLLASLGTKYVTTSDTGELSLTLMEGNTVNAIEKLVQMTNDQQTTYFRQKIKAADGYIEGINLFKSDHYLFYVSEAIDFPHFRDMESDWGLCPVPMLNEEQGRYYLTLDGGPIFFGIPIDVQDKERTSVIIEALCEESTSTLTPAYYDIVLARKFARDNESEAMLELMQSMRTYDVGLIYEWSGITDIAANCVIKNSTDIMSLYTKVSEKIEKSMNDAYDAISAIEG